MSKHINDTDSQLVATITPDVKITDKKGQVMRGTLDSAINNNGENIDIGNIYILLPGAEADGETVLFLLNTADDIDADPGMAGWEIKQVSGQPGKFLAKPTAASKSYTLQKGASVGFTLSKILLSRIVGACEITITVYPPTGETPLVEQKLQVVKVLDTVAEISLTTITPTVSIGSSVVVQFGGKGIAKFLVSESTSTETKTTHKDDQWDRNPVKTTVYTLDGTATGVHLQTQLIVTVLDPELKSFEPVSNHVDVDGNVLLKWQTEYADGVELECDDKNIILTNPYPIQGQGIAVGPIKRATVIHARPLKNGVKGKKESKNIYINVPVIESFVIAAKPLEPNKRCTFILTWAIKNASRFEIIEHCEGRQDVKLLVPDEARTFEVTPTHEQTTYKLTVFPYALLEDEEQTLTEINN